MRPIFSRTAARDIAALALLQKLRSFAAAPFAQQPWTLPMRGRRSAVRIGHGDWRAICRIDREAPSYVTEIDTRKKPGSFAALARLAAALGVSLDDIAAWRSMPG